jgi:hypothetical protein
MSLPALTLPSLHGSHRRTYETIFQHPLAHNLSWRDVHALLRHLAVVTEETNGNLKVTRAGEVLVLHPARTKEVAEADEMMALRHFLQRSDGPEHPAAAAGAGSALLVIDHHEARLFRSEMMGTVPERIVPYEPEGHFRHAPHSSDFSRGQEKPDPTSFFEPVARALQATASVLIFGTGTGSSSEMVQFTDWLKVHHPELSRRIAGAVVIDEHHLTDGQLLAKAREFYAAGST